MKKNFRHIFQLVYTVLTNSYLIGFTKGTIYQGNSKMVCVPGLNCYSCPGAVGSCPIGALQSVISGSGKNFSYYVTGFLILFGVTLGRLVCGFLCPFGFLQDLLHKIKIPKIKVPKKIDKILRYLKYIILLVFVIILPISLTNQYGIGSPQFCKWICPSGTLFGGIPLIANNESLQETIGALFSWKLILLGIILILSTMIYRPFCKYLCPLGGIYGFFNKISFFQMNVNKETCINCGACTKNCKMGVDVIKNINSAECIRCGDCKNTCPKGSITSGFKLK